VRGPRALERCAGPVDCVDAGHPDARAVTLYGTATLLQDGFDNSTDATVPSLPLRHRRGSARDSFAWYGMYSRER
jgi:hypothetical protein